MTDKPIVLPELSYKIMGALFAVHNELGSSLLEKYYQRAIAKEFDKQKIAYKREISVSLIHRRPLIYPPF